MGSGISTTPLTRDGIRPRPNISADLGSLNNSLVDDQRQHMVRTNQVAPIIIKNCMEEFQHVSEIKEPIVNGRIAENMPEHALVKGAYFLVKDVLDEMDKLTTLPKHLAPNLRRARGNLPVYGMGQPTRDGLNNFMHELAQEKHKDIFLVNLREEPVLFVRNQFDMIPYSPRHQDNLGECIFKSITRQFSAQDYECDIRKEILELSQFKDDLKFYFYDDVETFKDDPHLYTIAYEDDLAVTEEVYSRLTFNNSHIKYLRMGLPQNGLPPEGDFDNFLEIFKNLTEWSKKCTRVPTLVFTSHHGISRATFGMVLGSLMLAHKVGFPTEASKGPFPINEKCPNYERGEFLIIQCLVNYLPDGLTIKHQVDVIIDQCAELLNLRTAAAEAKHNLESITEDYIIEGISAKEHFLKLCIQHLLRYFYLICFNAYLHTQLLASRKEEGYQNALLFSETFTHWMQSQSYLSYLLSTINTAERTTTAKLVEDGTRYLVADDYPRLDVLSSQMDVRTSNFRRVPGLPIYGMAQPSREGLSSVIKFLMNPKQGHPSVHWFNLREDLVIECDGATYSIREKEALRELLNMSGISADEIKEKEEKLKNTVKQKAHFEVYQDIMDKPETRDFKSVLTCVDMVEQQCMVNKHLAYYRMPMPEGVTPPNQFYDELLSVMKNLEEVYKDEDGPALVFQCHNGKDRTTTAMAIAGLFICHVKGFPYGTKPGEEDRVSLPNAKYTQGHYRIVNDVVRRIPQGQQVKREVDFILNQCSDTMTPMHYHIREIIFVTYNKARKAKTEIDRLILKKKSLNYLERYIYLILFNTYLHCERRSKWQMSFSRWMREVAAEAGMYDILNKMAFLDFEDKSEILQTKTSRIFCPTASKLPVRGTII